MVRNIRVKGIPILAPLPPVLFNALIVGVEITIVSPGGFVFPAFLANALSVGLGELAVCYVLGLPLLVALEKAMGALKMGVASPINRKGKMTDY